tara:strand:+ start:10069 stop:10335 length:267 start_codon:yes stop_codon:yes gene_type:complete
MEEINIIEPIQPLLLNKDGSIKKIQKLKTENKIEYMKDYMKDYIKNKPTLICEICNGKYKAYQKYKHNQGKIHTLIQKNLDLQKELCK